MRNSFENKIEEIYKCQSNKFKDIAEVNIYLLRY